MRSSENNKLHCTYFAEKRCHSCALIDESEKNRELLRLKNLRSNLKVDLAGITVDKIVAPPSAFGSRSRVKLSVGGTTEHPVIGITNDRLDIVEQLNCPLHAPKLNEIVSSLVPLITKYKITPYEIKSRRGELKGVILKGNEEGTEVLLRFIVRTTETIPRLKKLVPELQMSFPVITSVSANIQPVPHQVLEGSEEIALTKNQSIWENYGDFGLAFGPQSFSQVTSSVARSLYEKVRSLAKEIGAKKVMDLYCGVGGFSFASAPFAGEITGVELSENSIKNARFAAKKNGYSNLNFFSESVESFLENETTSPDLAILNPPRAGLSRKVLDWLNSKKPKDVLYSSCNSESLGENLEALKESYRVVGVWPFDMFPLTKHLEILVQLEQKHFQLTPHSD